MNSTLKAFFTQHTRLTLVLALAVLGGFLSLPLLGLLGCTSRAWAQNARRQETSSEVTIAAVSYEGGDGTPTLEEINLFKNGIDDSLMNNIARYPWGESYIMMSFVEMYKATRDLFFLDKMVQHADAVFANRDDVKGRVDMIRNKIMPAWGSGTYGVTWFVYLSHNGMISYPIAAFCRIVLEDPELHPRYQTKANEYLVKIRQTLDCFDDNWREVGDRGYYLSPHVSGIPPFNGMIALGRAIIEAWLASGDAKYLNRAERLSRYLKSHLRIGAHDSYNWYYGEDYPTPEDISHGAIEADFAALAYRNGIVFTRQDIERFARTLVDVVQQPDGTMARCVDGSGSDPAMRTATSRWTDMTQVDSRVYDLAYKICITEGLPSSGQVGYAKIMKWKPRESALGNFAVGY